MARSYAKAYDDVWGDKRLSNNDVMVYTGLVRHSYGETMTVKRIGVRRLAEYCRVTPNTFNSCVKHLVECGWLEVVKGGKYGDAEIASEYHLLSPDVEGVVESVEDTTKSAQPAEKTRPYRKKFHKAVKSEKKDTSKPDSGLLRRLFTLNGAYLPDESDMAYMWQDTLDEFKRELAAGKYVLTEETFEQCKRHVYDLRKRFM